jgi:two-component system chemotaxis response regulator CheB
MPVMDGLETTRQIMAYHPTPILVLTASLSDGEVDITFQMLGAGALDVMEKPRLSDPAAVERCRRELLRKVRLLSRVRVVTHLRGRRSSAEGSTQPGQGPAGTSRTARPGDGGAAASAFRISNSAFPVIVIGASTGGPRVVRQVLAGLPAGFAAAVLVVQHIAQGFSAGMADWLAAASALPVRVAAEGQALAPGLVLVAPDRFDLLVQPGGAVHLSGLPLLLQRPAIDIVMQSVAAVFGGAAVGVLLTGMGRDGAVGMQAIRRAGGLTIAQDEASCAVSGIYGMPRAAAELGAAQLILPPERIPGALVAHLAQGPVARR